MGIVKISDELHGDIRGASEAMERSINAQAEYWIKIGKIAEMNPTLTYNEIATDLLRPSGSKKVVALKNG